MSIVDSLAQRLINMGPPTLEYHLERVPISKTEDALAWLHDQAWSIPETDRQRRLMVESLRFHRWLHRVEWQARGGRAW